MFLGEGEAVSMLLKFDSKEARRGSKIFEPKMLMKRGNEVVDFRGGRSDDENVIDVNEKIERSSGSIKKRGVSFGSLKTESKKLLGEFLMENYFKNMNTRVLSEPILLLLLIYQFEKLSIP